MKAANTAVVDPMGASTAKVIVPKAAASKVAAADVPKAAANAVIAGSVAGPRLAVAAAPVASNWLDHPRRSMPLTSPAPAP